MCCSWGVARRACRRGACAPSHPWPAARVERARRSRPRPSPRAPRAQLAAARAHRPDGLAPRPFPRTAGARAPHADAGAGQALDRLAVRTLGVVALACERTHAGFYPQRPVAGGEGGARGHPLERGVDGRGIAGPRGRLGQLGHDERRVAEVVVLEGPPRRIERGVVASDPVVEHRRRVGREVQHPTDAARGRIAHLALDQLQWP